MAVENDRIRQHIETLARRDPSDYEVLADALQTVTWPDGGSDRRHPDAHGWLGRFMSWRGGGPKLIPRACGCAMGRCLICN